MNVQGHYKESHSDLKDPGDFMYAGAIGHDRVDSLLFICPCGCGVLGALSFDPNNEGPKWAWNGNREKPTLSPSIQKTCECRWHGHLVNGVWIPC